MKYVWPNYEEGIVNVISSIEKYFGIKNERKSLKELDDALREKDYKNVVLVLYDGFGYNILRRNEVYAPFLNEHLVRSISSVLPPTTTAATSSFETGKTPYEHGWLGWNMYFKDFNEVMTLYLNTAKETKKPVKDYPGTSKLMPLDMVTKKVSKLDGYLGTIVSPYGGEKYQEIDEMNKKIIDICNNDKKNYIYAYYPDPDATMHEFGTDSNEAKAKYKLVNDYFKKLCDSLSDTLVIMVADHGHKNVSYITISDYETLYKMLKKTTSIDSRCCSFMVKDEYKGIFKDALKEVLKDDFIILSKEEVINKKIFGDGVKSKYFDDGIGDFIAVAIGDKAIRYDKDDDVFVSAHAGITEDETLIPLVLVKK